MKLNRSNKIKTLMIIDIIIIVSIYTFNFYEIARINSNNVQWRITLSLLPLVVGVYIVVLELFKMYKSIWSNIGVYEVINLIISTSISGICTILLIITGIGTDYIFIAVNISLTITLLLIIDRLGINVIKAMYGLISNKKCIKENVLIIGAGYCGKTVIAEIRKEEDKKYNIVGIIDDNLNKQNNFLNGVKILGNRNDIEKIVIENKINKILFSIAKIEDKDKQEIIRICKNTTAKIKVIPGIYELIDGRINLSDMRDIEYKDLLNREEIILDKTGINEFIKNKTILVTGGGGSIGSELCRQLAEYKPKKILILDIYENNAYDLQNELEMKFPDIDKEVIIASIRDKWRLDEIFSLYKPEVVFHAAAHKHVPLMESNPFEAIKNNVVGTLNLIKCADSYGVNKFVQISTDKAVNPTNIMGATKRICEMLIQAINKESNTEFVAVRFGNVLGSNGSVVPLFENQIKNGGPVTLTHTEITRYFMLIPEAAQLVIQAGAYAKGGEIFVLDMGEPVKIYNLAEQMIKQSGFIPHEEIEIEITGLRPGEKLYEELLVNKQILTRTANEKIFIDKKEDFNLQYLVKEIRELVEISKVRNRTKMMNKIKEIVPTFTFKDRSIEQEVAITE